MTHDVIVGIYDINLPKISIRYYWETRLEGHGHGCPYPLMAPIQPWVPLSTYGTYSAMGAPIYLWHLFSYQTTYF